MGGGLGGGGSAVGRGGQKVGALRVTHYYHMHTSTGDVRLWVWGYGGMYVIIALSRRAKERKKDERMNALCKHWRSPLKVLGLHWSQGRAPNATSSLRNK